MFRVALMLVSLAIGAIGIVPNARAFFAKHGQSTISIGSTMANPRAINLTLDDLSANFVEVRDGSLHSESPLTKGALISIEGFILSEEIAVPVVWGSTVYQNAKYHGVLSSISSKITYATSANQANAVFVTDRQNFMKGVELLSIITPLKKGLIGEKSYTFSFLGLSKPRMIDDVVEFQRGYCIVQLIAEFFAQDDKLSSVLSLADLIDSRLKHAS